jgi:hypothetical protein
MKEILVAKHYGFSRQPTTTTEISDENGVFQTAHAWVYDDKPVIAMASAYIHLADVFLMRQDMRDQYLAVLGQIAALRLELKRLEVAAVIDGLPVTFEWMVQHQKSTLQVPVPFAHKKEITNMRRGSRVIIDTTLSSWHNYVGKAGKLRRFNVDNAQIELADGRILNVPYAYLKPYNAESKEAAKKSKKTADLSHNVARQLEGVFK